MHFSIAHKNDNDGFAKRHLYTIRMPREWSGAGEMRGAYGMYHAHDPVRPVCRHQQQTGYPLHAKRCGRLRDAAVPCADTYTHAVPFLLLWTDRSLLASLRACNWQKRRSYYRHYFHAAKSSFSASAMAFLKASTSRQQSSVRFVSLLGSE